MTKCLMVLQSAVSLIFMIESLGLHDVGQRVASSVPIIAFCNHTPSYCIL